MTVYVDNPMYKFRGMTMCHMVSDTIEELHEMADKIGIDRKWYQPKSSPHYDVCLSKRKLAIKNGAKEADMLKMVEIIKSYRGDVSILEKREIEKDPTKCPKCGGEADNGRDRRLPHNAYCCTVCGQDLAKIEPAILPKPTTFG